MPSRGDHAHSQDVSRRYAAGYVLPVEEALDNVGGDDSYPRSVLAGTDFFSVENFTLRGLVNYYALFFTGHATPSVTIACVTAHDHAQCLQFFRIALRLSQP